MCASRLSTITPSKSNKTPLIFLLTVKALTHFLFYKPFYTINNANDIFNEVTMSQRWLSIVEYARTYSVSDMTVRRRIKNGKLEAQLKDGKYYIPVTQDHAAAAYADFESAPAPVSRSIEASSPVTAELNQANRMVVANHIPSRISETLVQEKKLHASADELIRFCDKAISNIDTIEGHIKASYQNKISSLEAALKLKNNEIAGLKQKLEDLEMLVKMLDCKAN